MNLAGLLILMVHMNPFVNAFALTKGFHRDCSACNLIVMHEILFHNLYFKIGASVIDLEFPNLFPFWILATLFNDLSRIFLIAEFTAR